MIRVEPLHWSSTLSCDDHDLIKLNFTLPEDAFISFNFSGHLVLEKMIFKEFSLSFPLYFFLPCCGSTLTPGIMIWTKLTLPYLKMLSHSYSFSGRLVFEKISKVFSLYIFICKMLTPPLWLAPTQEDNDLKKLKP